MVPCSNNILVPNIMVPWKITLTGRVFLDREAFKVGYNFFFDSGSGSAGELKVNLTDFCSVTRPGCYKRFY